MFEYIKGKVILKEIDFFVLENNDVGYRIYSPESSMEKLNKGEEYIIYTYLHVREDILDLYGFKTNEERNMFRMLLGISGIGPKVAMAILSQYKPQDLGVYILRGDIKALTKIKGIGKKGANRLVLELKDKLEGIDKFENGLENISNTEIESKKFDEAYSALVILGYSEKNAKRIVLNVYDEGLEVEEIIRLALKNV